MKSMSIKLGKGIDAKEAQELAKLCALAKTEVFISKGNIRANAKSIIGVISLSLRADDEILISTPEHESDEFYNKLEFRYAKRED